MTLIEPNALGLRYACDLAQLPNALAKRFVPMSFDAESAAFVRRAAAKRAGRWASLAQAVLCRVVGDFEANAMLGMYPMHLLGTEQWRSLLGDSARGRLLDVGAGSGDVTACLAPLFSEVVTTESARAAAKRLERRGFRCARVDVAEREAPDPPYDVAACLNVLDRTNRARSLLARLRTSIVPGGRVILALALPYDPFVYSGGDTLPPAERLTCSSPVWERAVAELVGQELEAQGLFVQAWTRAPYLSGGDVRRPLYVLDDVVLVCGG